MDWGLRAKVRELHFDTPDSRANMSSRRSSSIKIGHPVDLKASLIFITFLGHLKRAVEKLKISMCEMKHPHDYDHCSCRDIHINSILYLLLIIMGRNAINFQASHNALFFLLGADASAASNAQSSP